MDTTLVTVTVLSMGMAAALSAIVWRMLRLERHRSNARVAALTALAKTDTAPRDSAAPREALLDMPLADGAETSVVTSGLFVERQRTSPWGPRVAVMAAAALIVSSVVLFSLAAREQHAVRRAGTAGGASSGATPSPSQANAPSGPGLELLTLRDSHQDGTLTISGTVQNPRNGAPLSHVAVTAYTFDANGSFLASGRALIDVTALSPGNESPFIVTVPVTDAVARYRIGFRDETGRVIAHTDRRQQGPLAANW